MHVKSMYSDMPKYVHISSMQEIIEAEKQYWPKPAEFYIVISN